MNDVSQDEVSFLRLDNFQPALLPSPGQDEEYFARHYATLLYSAKSGRPSGSMGTVYRAKNVLFETMALKVLSPRGVNGTLDNEGEIDERHRVAFDREYRTLAYLSNLPCFPTLYGRGSVDGNPAILMEWVEGVTLNQARSAICAPSADGTLQVDGKTVAALGIAVLNALLLAGRFKQKLVHRDLSASNIMIRTTDHSLADQFAKGSFDVCLVDFGSAALVEPVRDGATFTMLTGTMCHGTPAYAPPEMLTDDLPIVHELRQSPAVDVYALCSVLYELYSGKLPFDLDKRQQDGRSWYVFKLGETVRRPEPHSPEDAGLVEAIMSGIKAMQNERPDESTLHEQLTSWLAGIDGDAPARAARQTAGLASLPSDETPKKDCRTLTAKDVVRPREERMALVRHHELMKQSAERAAGSTAEGVAERTPNTVSPPSPSATNSVVSRRALIIGGAALAGLAAAGIAFGTATLGTSDGQVEPASEGQSNADEKNEGSPAAASGELVFGEGDPPYFPMQDVATGLWGYISLSCIGADDWWMEPALKAAPLPFSEGLASARDPETGLVGYLSESGGWAIEPQFAEGKSFHDGLAAVMDLGENWGFVDTSGEWVINPNYLDVLSFSEGLAAAQYVETREDGSSGDMLSGYLDTSGNWAIEPVFRYCRSFSDGVAFASRGGIRWSLIDRSGQDIMSEPWRPVGDFSAGLAPVRDLGGGELLGYADTSGDLIVPLKFGGGRAFCYDGMNYYAPAQDHSTGLWGIIDETGEWITDPQYVDLGPITLTPGGQMISPAMTYSGNLCGIIEVGSPNPTWIVRPAFQSAVFSHE